MYPGTTCQQQQHARNSTDKRARMPMTAETEQQSEAADRYDQQQHLQMKMIVRELPYEWQQNQQQRHRQAVQYAKPGKRDGYSVEEAYRF